MNVSQRCSSNSSDECPPVSKLPQRFRAICYKYFHIVFSLISSVLLLLMMNSLGDWSLSMNCDIFTHSVHVSCSIQAVQMTSLEQMTSLIPCVYTNATSLLGLARLTYIKYMSPRKVFVAFLHVCDNLEHFLYLLLLLALWWSDIYELCHPSAIYFIPAGDIYDISYQTNSEYKY